MQAVIPETCGGHRTTRLRESRGNPLLGGTPPGQEWLKKIVAHEPLSIPDSFLALEAGFHRFEQRTMPTFAQRVAFRNVAGNIIEVNDPVARREIKKLLERVQVGGAFLVLAHGGNLPCGAVAAKQKHMETPLNEPPPVLHIVDHIPDEVYDFSSPYAERINAKRQAEILLEDPEFASIIHAKNITVIAGVCSDGNITFTAMNREGWTSRHLTSHHPVLIALRRQMKRALVTACKEGKALSVHFAHSLFLWDPEETRVVLNQNGSLEMAGIGCVDARLPPRVPGPRYLFRMHPGEGFVVTCSVNGSMEFTQGELGSAMYGLSHVHGIAPRQGGNGHTVAFASTMEAAALIKEAALANPVLADATQDGRTISLAAFNGRRLVVTNEAFEQRLDLPYNPIARIL